MLSKKSHHLMSLPRSIQQKQLLDAYRNYADTIFRYCYYRVFDRGIAKDLLEKTYCRAWRHLATGGSIENTKTFLYKTAHTLIVQELGKQDTYYDESEDLFDVMVLRHIAHLSQEEIVFVLNRAHRTIPSRIAMSFKRLMAIF